MAGQYRGTWSVREKKPAFNAFSFVSTAPAQKPRKKSELPSGFVPSSSIDLSTITERKVYIGDDEWTVKKQSGNRIRVQRTRDGASAWRQTSDIEAIDQQEPQLAVLEENKEKDLKKSPSLKHEVSLMRAVSIKMKMHGRLQAVRDRHADREAHVAKLKAINLESRQLKYHLQGNAQFECAKQSGDRVRLIKADGSMFWAHLADVDLSDEDQAAAEVKQKEEKEAKYQCIQWEDERVLVRYIDSGLEEWKAIDEVCDEDDDDADEAPPSIKTTTTTTKSDDDDDEENTAPPAIIVLDGVQYETLEWSDDDRVLLRSVQDGTSEWRPVSEMQDTAKLHNPDDDDLDMAEPPPLPPDEPLLEAPPETNFIFCVYDRDSNFRAYMRADGHVYNNTNALIGFLDKDALQAASSQEEYLGEIEQLISGDADLVVADATNEWACFIDLGTAYIKDYQGTTVAELKQNGDVFGNAGTFLGNFQGFDYHLIKLVALYLALIDPGMLTEVAVAQDAALDEASDPDRFIRRVESSHLSASENADDHNEDLATTT